jgi:S1-C subfamily serine protease
MSAELIELSNALVRATDRAAASVVAVHAEARGSSSGVIWRPGVIVTAEHALRRDEEIQATLPNGRVVPATLAGRDPSTDLAVLKCPDAGAASAERGDAAAIKPGSITLVVGRTRASGPVAALGVVSLAVSERQTWGGSYLVPYVRLDVGLQPTAVGGAVVELREPLTPREHEVLQMISAGLGNKEIAERLSISDHSVKIHAASILGKLGASSRTRFHWNSSRSRASLGHP